jgi:hypothetical protein
MRFGVTPIQSLELDRNCRSATVKVLAGLQHIYASQPLCDEILRLVEDAVNPEGKVSNENGRPGMDYWQILVLASVRLGCNLTYDQLHDLTYQHRALRIMLGFGDWDMSAEALELFSWRSIHDNVCKLPPETIKAISDLIVSAGHELVPEAKEVVRGDSFVVGTNIHYPIDRRQLGDGIRKLIETCTVIGKAYGIPGWRKHHYLLKQNRGQLKAISMTSRSRGKNRKQQLEKIYRQYFTFAESIVLRAVETLETMSDKLGSAVLESSSYSDLVYYLSATEYIRQLTVRRIIDEEVISNPEKLHSIFEAHTELINRGKQPQAVEFGHRVLVIEDSAGFICHHEVMDIGLLDKDVLCRALEDLQKRLGHSIRGASFDCGFHTPDNQTRLEKIVSQPCVPAKGVLQAKEQKEKAPIQWHRAREYHAGVESAIHALQSGNGLGRCRDHTYVGYERYVAMGVLGRNLCTLGRLVIAQEWPKAPAAYSERKAVNF